MSENQSALQTNSKNVQSHTPKRVQNQESCSELLDALEKVRSKIAPGPAPAFNEAHIIMAIEIIAKQKIVGRTNMSQMLNLGIGTTRTVLKHLKTWDFVTSSKYGFALSEKGEKLFFQIQSNISKRITTPKTPLARGPVVLAAIVKNAGHKIVQGIEQRNAAIRAGALGATTLIFCNRRIVMPSKKKHNTKSIKQIQQAITNQLTPQENDVIILCSGTTPINAEIGVIMAAIKVLNMK